MKKKKNIKTWQMRIKKRTDEITAQVKESGGFSIFWITDNIERARIAERMQREGVLVCDKEKSVYPWNSAKIVEAK